MVDTTPLPRPAQVAARWVRAGAVIFALEMATLVVGFVSVVTSEALLYPSSKRDYVCDGHEFELISNVTWLAWLVLLNLATALLLIWLLRGRGNVFSAVSALMSVASVRLLFPSWRAVGTAMDCGM
jgi:hypothetical protein